MIEEEEEGIRSLVSRTCGAAMCANSAIAMRSSSGERFAEHAQEAHRPLPPVAGDVPVRTTRTRPAG
jgi:hypothetical protein